MILLKLETSSGSMYIADVVNKKIKRIPKTGDPIDWTEYQELQGGNLGESLRILWGPVDDTYTTPVVKISHPETQQ